MPPKTHNKLVRNRIPEIIAANNQTYTPEILSDTITRYFRTRSRHA